MEPASFKNPDFTRGPRGSRDSKPAPFLQSEAPFHQVAAAMKRFGIPTENRTLHEILLTLHMRMRQHLEDRDAEPFVYSAREISRELEYRQLLALVTHTKKLIRWVYRERPEAMPFQLTMELFKTPIGNPPEAEF